MQEYPMAFAAMQAFNQFVLWKAVPSKRRPGKFDKFPCNIAGNIVDAHNPQDWVTADLAVATAAQFGESFGVGFVFTENDPFFFVDIDGAFDGAQWSPLSTQLCQSFPGAAVEISHSGTGLHIIGQYSGDEPIHGCKNIPLHLELYTSGRFVALTGTSVVGNAGTDHTASLSTVIGQYYSVMAEERVTQSWTTTHVEGSYPPPTDEKLLEKAFKSCKAGKAETIFGGAAAKANFSDLWKCNVAALAVSYPDDVREYDASSADAALAQHLAFWTGGNCERIERLMRLSGLVRDKWDYHKSYMERTITGAVSRQNDHYSIGAPIEMVDTAEVHETVFRDGYQLMSPTQQIDFFDGCVYIAHTNKIFTPNGSTLKSEQFNVMYGGYNFTMDNDGDKTTKKAWEAFTETQCMHNPKADGFCFRPALAQGTIVTEEGMRYVNTYVPIDIDMTQGDVSPFIKHLEKVLPHKADRDILLAYMAACIQYKGYKIQWAPLIQGCEGNGKTLFTRCVAYAVGKRYTHFPKAAKIDSEFNLWMANKLFIGIEDVYVPDNRREIIETLKPMITGGDGIEIQGKGADQVTSEVCCNFMLNSNHKDAIKTTLNDRRFCVFYTAQQDAIDLVRDGMNGEYFPSLYDWLNNGGYAHVADFLINYAIPDALNPTTQCQRAPQTTSTAEAVTVGMGSVEQEINEAVDEGRTGFGGGWASSFALDKLLEDMRKSGQVPRNRRRELMRSIGYDYHPGLKDGRVNNVIAMEAGKPRLYIKAGHIHANLTSGAEIARFYAAAQGDLVAATFEQNKA